MAFVNEKIPEEEKEKFTFPVATRRDGSKPTLSKWTIDRERDAFLVITKVIGGGYGGTEPIEHFVLSWKSHLIGFSGEYKITGNRETGYSMTWHLSEIEIPPSIKDKRSEIMTLIKDALDVKGMFFNRGAIESVVIQF